MKKILFIILFIITVSINSFSGNSFKLLVPVNTSQCANCYYSFPSINKIRNTVDITFIIKQQDNNYIDEFLKEYGISRKYKITVSDSIYNKMNGTDLSKAVCQLFNKDKKLFEFNYSSIMNNIDIINLTTADFSKITEIFKLDTVKLSNRLNTHCNENQYIQTDYLLNKSVVATISDNNDVVIEVIKASKINKAAYLEKSKIDANFYNGILWLLKSLNKQYMRIENTFFPMIHYSCLIHYLMQKKKEKIQ